MLTCITSRRIFNVLQTVIKYMSLETHDQDVAIYEAIEKRDSEALYQLDAEVKEQGDDEYAEKLLATAKRFDREDWAYDNSIGN